MLFLKKMRGRFLPLLLVLLALLLLPPEASAVTRRAFLRGLLEARGLDWGGAGEKDGALFVLKTGLVTDGVTKLDAPVTRREAVRWSVQALGLSEEARILSGLPLSFEDAHTLNLQDRGVLFVATRMSPRLIAPGAAFRGSRKLGDPEMKALLGAVRKASRGLTLDAEAVPVPGLRVRLHREGVSTGVPRWRVFADGFPDQASAVKAQRFLASKGFEMKALQPHYEWFLRSSVLEEYGQVKRLSSLIRNLGKKVRILPSVANPDSDILPRCWVKLTAEPERFVLRPLFPQDGISALEPLSLMARRGGAAAAVNAGFFAVTGWGKGYPIGLLKSDWVLLNGEYPGRSCLGWNDDNEAAFGSARWATRVETSAGPLSVNSLNRYTKGDSVVVYTPAFGKATPKITSNEAAEVVVRSDQAAEVRGAGGPIEQGTWVLAGYGRNAGIFRERLPVGSEVRLTGDLTGSEGEAWDAMTSILQAGPLLLQDGEPCFDDEGFGRSLLTLRHPRSAVGLTEDGEWFFFILDGRNGLHSVGATIDEFREVLKSCGAAWALNLDGGGSTELFIGGRIWNVPSEGKERLLNSGLGFLKR